MINTFETEAPSASSPSRPESHPSTISNSSRLRQPPWPARPQLSLTPPNSPSAVVSSDCSRCALGSISPDISAIITCKSPTSFDFYTNLMLIPAAKLARVPVVYREPSPTRRPHDTRAIPRSGRCISLVRCRCLQFASRGRSPHRRRPLAQKIAIIGNALPAAAFTAAPAALPKPPGVVRVGMVARMNHRYKNHSGFLRIAAQIHKRMPDVEFLLAGDGPLRQDLDREAASLGLGASAIFLGDRQDMPNVLGFTRRRCPNFRFRKFV